MSNIIGLGNDIVEISRISSSIEKHGAHFLDRLFTKKEQSYCTQYKNRDVHFAGRYAAKEAISKALGTGFGKDLRWLDIEILNNKMGKPEVFFSDSLNKNKKLPNILITISHSKNYATAVALALS